MSTHAGKEVGLRQRKRRETRAALSLAAIRLCVQRGWKKVTVDVKVLDEGRRGQRYPDMPWEPKVAFTALAECYGALGH